MTDNGRHGIATKDNMSDTKKYTNEFRIPLDCGYSLYGREELATHRERSNEKPQVVMIVVHGGPGLADHTESFPGLRRLVKEDDTVGSGCCHAVVFYDQLGCGRSSNHTPLEVSSLHNKNELSRPLLAYYTEELRQVIHFCRRRYNNYPIALLGHSWGGQIVLEYLLHGNDDNVICAIISNTPLDETTYEQKQRALRAALDEATRQFLEQDERQQAMTGSSVGSAIFSRLIGTSETDITGEMNGWSILDRLSDLSAPCLFISGTFDTIPWQEYTTAVSPHRDHEVAILEGADHGPFFGATVQAYFQTIDAFLQRMLQLPSRLSVV